jgi:hypothetical protein
VPDNNTQNSASARKKLGDKAKKKESSVSDLLSQIEQSRARENMRAVGAVPDSVILPTIKQAKEVGSPVDSLLVEEMRRRSRFVQKAPKRKIPFQR